MASKKRAAGETFDDVRLARQIQSPDDGVRGDAVRSLCPCHAGWEVFESHVGEVMRAFGDRSREVRAHALYVFEDAAQMQHAGELAYDVQEAEALLRRKRASRFRPEEGGSRRGKRPDLGGARSVARAAC